MSCCDDNILDCDCPNGRVDASCIQYNGDNLSNLDIETGTYLDVILQQLNDFVFGETEFTPVSTDSIVVVEGGTNGHSPVYTVRIDDEEDNAITVSGAGLYVPSSAVGDGKVKVDSSDEKAYLEDQMEEASDASGIVTITPTKIAGKIHLVPSLDIEKLIDYLKTNHFELLCSIVGQCVPEETTTTTTTAAPTTTTTTSSTTTTTTTTIAPNDFIIENTSGSSPFTITLTDEGSLIDYLTDNTTFNNQTSNHTYSGSDETSKVTIIHAPSVQVNIELYVDDVLTDAHEGLVGSHSFEGIDARTDIKVVLKAIETTTTTTSTTTAAPTTTTTTTTAAPTTTTTTTTAAPTTTTTTTTAAPTTTTTTTTLPSGNFLVTNNSSGTTVTDITISAAQFYTIDTGSYPVGPAENLEGTHAGASGVILIESSPSGGYARLHINGNVSPEECIALTGSSSFSSIIVDVGETIEIIISDVAC